MNFMKEMKKMFRSKPGFPDPDGFGNIYDPGEAIEKANNFDTSLGQKPMNKPQTEKFLKGFFKMDQEEAHDFTEDFFKKHRRF